MIIQNIIDFFEEIAPQHYAESFDNTGLLVGDKNSKITSILVTHDTVEEVIDEAIQKKCNLIVSFHPIIFNGLKKINNNSYVERVVTKAIQNKIAIFAIHTAYDNCWTGVNYSICKNLGLINQKILIPKKDTIKKLVTFVPHAKADNLRESLFNAGAGQIGNYEQCSFNTKGLGSFKPNQEANPTLGKKGILHFEAETQIGITFAAHLETQVLKALFDHHPYDEVAYEITTLENVNQKIGMGMLAELAKPMTDIAFLEHVKLKMTIPVIKHSKLLNKKIKKIAVLGGSGSFAINAAKQAGADVFLTADLKYHDFYKAENQMIIADIGHYESEQFTKYQLVDYLTKKITNFAPSYIKGIIKTSEVNTNPINYL